MKRVFLLCNATAALAILLAGCTTAIGKREAVSPAPSLANVSETASVILENAFVRVTRVSLSPGASLPMHSGEQRVIYALSDYSISWTDEGNTDALKSWSAGEAHFHEPGDHSLVNTGESDANFLVVERLGTDLTEGETADVSDVAIASPGTTELLLENDTFRVLRVTLLPGEAQPMHAGRPRVIYSLSDYQIEWKEVGEPVKTRTWSQGGVHWHLSGDHAAKNRGNTTASWLIVSLKD